jgi:hypothetical protein
MPNGTYGGVRGRQADYSDCLLLDYNNMNEKELLPSLAERLQKDFSLEKNSLPALDNISIIREHLIKKVTELMGKNFKLFLNSLYRIDIDEIKVNEAISSKDKTTIPEKLADLIIERQLLRVRTQMLYRQGKL